MTVEVSQPVRDVLLYRLDAGEALTVEALGARRRGGAAAHHQDGIVSVGRAIDLTRDDPGDLARVRAHRKGEGARAIAGDMALDPVLGRGDLLAHHGLRVAAERGVPERMVADLVAAARQVL